MDKETGKSAHMRLKKNSVLGRSLRERVDNSEDMLLLPARQSRERFKQLTDFTAGGGVAGWISPPPPSMLTLRAQAMAATC